MYISHFITESKETITGSVPVVRPGLNFRDHLGTVMVRLSLRRKNYMIRPGIYATGNPSETSDVFVTGNYKLSFDHLRKNLAGRNAWILVLDTKGINVWCAAGKGTFGTLELVRRIKSTRLSSLVTHRRIIVPQLGAVGISAHEVKTLTGDSSSASPAVNENTGKRITMAGADFRIDTGFRVVYGPVRAADIGRFIENGYVSSAVMRKVNFTLKDRAVLIPVDFFQGKFKLLAALAIIFLLSGLNQHGLNIRQTFTSGPADMLNMVLAYAAGIIFMPLLLPYLPGRSFSFKGFITGFICFLIMLGFGHTGLNALEKLSWLLMMSGISSFVAMNFTGSSTYTSLSGVIKEMRIALPLQIAASSSGLILFVVSKVL